MTRVQLQRVILNNLCVMEWAMLYCDQSGKSFRLIFLADGPGLAHKDTWEEACKLDGSWNGNVRVTTLKTAAQRIHEDWLQG